MIVVWLWISLILLTVYVLYLCWLIIGWIQIPKHYDTTKLASTIGVSIILPVRNEVTSINNWLKNISNLNYPKKLIDIVIVDDHSTDNTIKKMDIPSNINVRHFDLKEKYGKKEAITLGVAKAIHEIIITTDADCSYHPEWLNFIVNHYEKTRAKMIISPVKITPKNNWFNILDRLDFMSLVGTGLAMAYLNKPFISNGANLSYKKQAFYDVNGFNMNSHIPTGDDVFLTQKFSGHFPNQIKALVCQEAIVETSGSSNLREFMQQRVRWGSKTKYYTSIMAKLIAYLVGLVNISILINFALVIFYPSLVEFFMVQWVIKFVFDFLFLFLIASFFKERRILVFAPIFELIYPIYLLTVGSLAMVKGYTWKERKF